MEELGRWHTFSLCGLAEKDPRANELVARCLEQRVLTFFSTFTDDPLAFRAALAETRTVISGSSVVSFIINRALWETDNINLYCPQHTFERFCDFLVEELHARELPNTTVSGRLPLRLPTIDHRELVTARTRFSVTRSPDATPVTVIASSDITVTMNFLTANSLHIAYPWLLDNRKILARPGAVRPSLLARWQTRGFTLSSSAAGAWNTEVPSDIPRCAPQGCCPSAIRYFDDDHCVVLRFGDADEDSDRDKDLGGRVLSAAWVFGGSPCGSTSCVNTVVPVTHSTVLLDTENGFF